MKDSTKKFLLLSLSFGVPMSFLFILMYGVFGILSGIVSGLLFAALMTLFLNTQSKKFELIKQEMSKSNNILYDGAANHFRGKEAVGGWLFLTDKAIIFKSHGYNVQNNEMVIPLENVNHIIRTNNFGIVPNVIMITTSTNQAERFVVHSREIWIQKITQAKG